MRGLVLAGLALSLGACAFIPAGPEPGTSGVRRTARAESPRRTPAPILRPVNNHVSDSIPEAFPALDPPVADEVIYGAGTRPDRVMRARLPPAGTVPAEDLPDSPRPDRLAFAPPVEPE